MVMNCLFLHRRKVSDHPAPAAEYEPIRPHNPVSGSCRTLLDT